MALQIIESPEICVHENLSTESGRNSAFRTMRFRKPLFALQVEEEFKEYAEKAKSLPPRTTDADKLVLYGLYKQATVGSVNTNRPGFFSPTERAKWDAWKAVEGKSKQEAMKEYIAKVKQLQEEHASSSSLIN